MAAWLFGAAIITDFDVSLIVAQAWLLNRTGFELPAPRVSWQLSVVLSVVCLDDFFFKEFGGPVHDFLISYLVSFISFWIQITFCEVCFSVMKHVYMSCRESERGVRCVRDMFQKALRCHWWWMDRTGAVPVVWVPQEQSLTSCTAVRGSVAAVYRRRNRILLLTWNMNGNLW